MLPMKTAPSDSAPSNDGVLPRRSRIQRIADALFGYDFFISYAHADGRTYAVGLAKGLKERGFDVFLDTQDYLAGDDWKTVGAWALKRTNRLVLVGTPKALESQPVRRELEIYTRAGKRVIPIDVGGCLAALGRDHPVAGFLQEATIRLPEPEERRLVGPGDKVLQGVAHAFEGERQQAKKIRWITSAAIALLLLAIASVVLAGRARESARIARVNELVAYTQAELAKDNHDPSLTLLLGIAAVDAANRMGVIQKSRAHTALAAAVGSATRLVRRFEGNGAPATSVSFSSEGNHLITAQHDGGVRIWDVNDGREIRMLANPGHEIRHAAFDPSGRFAFTVDRILGSTSVRIWEAESGELVRTIGGPDRTIVSAAYDPTGRLLIVADYFRGLEIWDVRTGQATRSFQALPGGVFAARYSPDGKSIVTAGGDGVARTWDSATGLQLRVFSGHQDWTPPEPFSPYQIRDASFSPDGRHILTVGSDGAVRIWDTQDGREVRRLLKNEFKAISAKFSHSGHYIVTIDREGKVRLWESVNGRHVGLLPRQETPTAAAAFSPDDTHLATADKDGIVRIWEVSNGPELRKLVGHKGAVMSAMFHPMDRRFVLTAGSDATARVWDAVSGRGLGQLHIPAQVVGPSGAAPLFAAYSQDGRFIAAGGYSGLVKIWNATNGVELILLQGLRGGPRSAAFSMDGKSIAIACGDGVVRIMETKSGKEVRSLIGHDGNVNSVTFSQKGHRIVTVGSDGTASIWNTSSGRRLFRIEAHTNDISAATFSTDGSVFITAGRDGIVHVWDSASGRSLFKFTGHRGPVRSVAYSPDGRFVLTAGQDSTVRIWDPERGLELRQILGHEGAVMCAAYSHDGEYIVTAGHDGTVRIWAEDTNVLVDLARQRISRRPPELTVQERHKFGFFEPQP